MKKILSIVFIALFAVPVFAHEGHESMMEKMTPEMRNKMADMHTKMAECLRSTKEMKECHEEMQKACEDSMGKDGCAAMHKNMMAHMHMKDMKMKMMKKDKDMKSDTTTPPAENK